MRIRRRPQPTPPLSDLLPRAPPQHDAPPPSAAPTSTFPPRAVLTHPSLHPKKEEEEEVEDREGRAPLVQVMRGKQHQEEVGGAHKTGNIGGVHSTAGSSSSGAKVEDDGGVSDEGDDEKKAGVANGGGGGRKRRRRPAALMEGSRCSRVNGRGWRCCQQTLVGYSLCEHHLGKGRLRSVSSVRCNGAGRRKGGRDTCGDGEEPPKPRQRGRKLGMVKARSISSLLHQTDQAADADDMVPVMPPTEARGHGEGIGATV